MPTYLTPGVYVEEVSSGSKPIEGVATSVAAFIGVAERGPINKPISITKPDDFENTFGGYLPPGTDIETNSSGDTKHRSYLAHAVTQFFNHGGSRCYVVRIAKDDAKAAESADTGLLADVKAAYETAKARHPLNPGQDTWNPGQWANDHYDVNITPSKSDPTILFDLTVRYWKTPTDRDLSEDEWKDGPVIKESYVDLSHWPDSREYAPNVVNEASRLVSIEIDPAHIAADAITVHGLGGEEIYVLSSFILGDDGSKVDPSADGQIFDDALHSLDTIKDVRLIAIPGIHDQAKKGVGYCDNRPERDCVFFMDPPENDESPSDIITWLEDSANSTSSSYGVLYYPWIKADNFGPKGGTEWFPPSAFVMGMCGRIDQRRGVWKAPAGLETPLVVKDVKYELTDKEQERLNPRGINCLRVIKGTGTVIWGTRTRSTRADPEWRYLPVRRTAIMIERSIYGGIQWAVFEPNDHRLWSSLRANIGNFMDGLFRAGAFQGEKASDAYFVRCGLGDTMTQGEIDAGQVIVQVGFAPLKPAEFVIVRIQQKVNQK